MKIKFVILLLLFVAGLGVVGILYQKQNTASFIVAPTPAGPTPTPLRNPSKLASESAFLNLEVSISSLSSIIKNYPISDPRLSIPRLDLKLGLK